MQSPSSHGAFCAHTDCFISECRACRNDPDFLGVHGSELQPWPKHSFGPCAYGVWRTQCAGSQYAGSHCSKCACLLKPLGDDDISAAPCQHTAGDSRKWQARYHCD